MCSEYIPIDLTSTFAGIISTSGEHWQNLRRFALRHLKDFGMGKSRLVEAIQREANDLVIDFKRRAGSESIMLLPHSIIIAVLNVIWRMVAGNYFLSIA